MRVITPQGAAAERGKSLKEQRDGVILALKTERGGYVTRGLKDRVKQVDAQLKHYRAIKVPEDGEPEPAPETVKPEGHGSIKAAPEPVDAEPVDES